MLTKKASPGPPGAALTWCLSYPTPGETTDTPGIKHPSTLWIPPPWYSPHSCSPKWGGCVTVREHAPKSTFYVIDDHWNLIGLCKSSTWLNQCIRPGFLWCGGWVAIRLAPDRLLGGVRTCPMIAHTLCTLRSRISSSSQVSCIDSGLFYQAGTWQWKALSC